MVKNPKVWVVDPLVKVQSDTLPEDTYGQIELTICRGEYESIQIALRAEDKKVTLCCQTEDLTQALGEEILKAENLELRLVDYTSAKEGRKGSSLSGITPKTSSEISDSLLPLPDLLELEPQYTRAIWLTIYAPREAPAGAYIGNLTLRTDTSEVVIPLLVKILDITLPLYTPPLKQVATQYGLKIWPEEDWKLIDTYTQEGDKQRATSSIRSEMLREGAEDLKLLWLLEQAQIKLAKQRGLDLNEFDPRASGKKICSPIINGLPGCTNIHALHKIRREIIAAIQRTQVPLVDLSHTLTVKASVAPNTPADFAYGSEGRFSFQFQIECSPPERVELGDYLRFTFRDLFTNRLTFYNHPLKKPLRGKMKITLSAKEVKLEPSSYHVRIDFMRKDTSLSPIAPGSCQVYITRENESPKHFLASFITSRLAYMWDEKRKIYYHILPGRLPYSGDPFDPTSRPLYERELRLEIIRIRYEDWTGLHPMEVSVPEAQHDGGMGLLYAAKVFRKIGELERALFCERALRRIISLVLRKMITEDKTGHKCAKPWGPRQQDTILLKFLCEAFLYFRDTVGDKEYAQELLKEIRLIGEYQFSLPNFLGCSEGKVYDGRILVGLSTYCLTEYKLNGQFDKAHTEEILSFASKMSENILRYRGWYDNGGPEGHDGYGTMNAIWGLLSARRIALVVGDKHLAEVFKKSILTAFNFLARTNSSLTGYTQWIPSRHGAWCAGDMYQMLNEIEEQFGKNKIVQWYRSHLLDRDINYFTRQNSSYGETSSFGSRNALGAILRECEEYKQAIIQNHSKRLFKEDRS